MQDKLSLLELQDELRRAKQRRFKATHEKATLLNGEIKGLQNAIRILKENKPWSPGTSKPSRSSKSTPSRTTETPPTGQLHFTPSSTTEDSATD